MWFMEQHQPEPQATTALSTIRHDGWTGEKMATFCETLAETAVVAEACEAARRGISGAYAARRRSPAFAAAWDAALSIARERLADTLLARSMEGNVEQIYRDGELVGERHSSTIASASPSSSGSTGLQELTCTPAEAGAQSRPRVWTPAFAGVLSRSTGRSPSMPSAPATTKRSRGRWRCSNLLP